VRRARADDLTSRHISTVDDSLHCNAACFLADGFKVGPHEACVRVTTAHTSHYTHATYTTRDTLARRSRAPRMSRAAHMPGVRWAMVGRSKAPSVRRRAHTT